MEELFEKLVAWLRRRTGSPAEARPESRAGRSESSGQPSERFLSLSESTVWIAAAEAEYEVEHGGGGPAAPERPNRQALLESPVPNGAAPFGHPNRASVESFGTPGSEERVEDAVPMGIGLGREDRLGRRDGDHGGTGRRERRGPDGRYSPGSRHTKWNELWEADGLLSHDGTYLRFQSWDGGHDVEVLIGDMTAEVDDDELTLTGSNFRFVVEDIEPVTPPNGIRPDLMRVKPSDKGDRFGGLLADFPGLGTTPS